MIGQENIRGTVNRYINDNSYPRFSIIVGPEGSGKKMLSKYIGNKLSATVYMADISVDSVRDIISNAYHCVGRPVLYVLADADKMSPAAKNALLKVTEEPPRNAYFILTLTDLNNTLATIKSRGTVLYTDPYTVDELVEYYESKYQKSSEVESILSEVCNTPGEVDKLVSMRAVEFYAFVGKVVDNIAVVSGSNSFNIANSIQFKDTDADKYDLKLFLKAFMSVCSTRLRDDPMHYASGIRVTSKYLQELRITGINKASTFDMWLLDVRGEWL